MSLTIFFLEKITVKVQLHLAKNNSLSHGRYRDGDFELSKITIQNQHVNLVNSSTCKLCTPLPSVCVCVCVCVCVNVCVFVWFLNTTKSSH